DTRIAVLKPNLSGGGVLKFSDGSTFRITSKGSWRPLWTLLADNGQPLLRIHSREKTVELPTQSHLSEDRLILLAIFGWHIMQQASEDAASVAASAIVAIS